MSDPQSLPSAGVEPAASHPVPATTGAEAGRVFDPTVLEPQLYAQERASGAFAPTADGDPFVIIMPPPNTTGSLHLGHALTMTLQDVLTRYRRMRGDAALWLPGTDHAGIATQMVVERQLAAEGTDRWTLGRQAFLDRVWDFKHRSGGTIVGQLERLGASADWSRLMFTLDEGPSRAVAKVFSQLYREKLIYRAKRLVNWDPKLKTAISDLEVEAKPVKGKLWLIDYPLTDDPERFVTVATTRPETMLGDVAVAVHPDDERFQDLVGRTVRLPLVGRDVPILADDFVDRETGTGAVKITPAHDFTDYEVGQRHQLPQIAVMDLDARMAGEAVPERFRGLDRYEARTAILAALAEEGRLRGEQDHVSSLPHGDRSGVPLEPLLTDQWFCDAKTLAQPALAAVRDGRTRFVPDNWSRVYEEWLVNIHPWCISRQLWWGHRIPAWYGPDGHVFVAETEGEAQADAARHYGRDVALERDPDVLDTWFSSALWPFTTLGWPDETPDLKRFYPSSVLVTAFDIIFFWVARMMMLGLHFMGDVPFRTVYIHALVRDARGQKMSKSKGNVLDPLELFERFGADATRMTLASLAAPGRDIKISESRIEGYRNFATKLWNATRFAEMNQCRPVPGFDPAAAEHTLNRWILGALAKTTREVGQAIEQFRFHEAASALYHFTWSTFCDWYLELAKPLLQGGEQSGAAAETRATTGFVLDRLFHVLHPFMPHLTEALNKRAGAAPERLLVAAAWPAELEGFAGDTAAAEEIDRVVRLITLVRRLRADVNVPAAAQLDLLIAGADEGLRAQLSAHVPAIQRLARLASLRFDEAMPATETVQAVLGHATVRLPVGAVIDVAAEAARLKREHAKVEAEAGKLAAKLANADFVARAPEEVVEENRERLEELHAQAARLAEAVASLS